MECARESCRRLFEPTAEVGDGQSRRVQEEECIAGTPEGVSTVEAERSSRVSERSEVLRVVEPRRRAHSVSARLNERAVATRRSGERHLERQGVTDIPCEQPANSAAAIGACVVAVAGASVKGANSTVRSRRRRSVNAQSHTHTLAHTQTYASTQSQARAHTRAHVQSARMHRHADAIGARMHSHASAHIERARTGAARSRRHEPFGAQD